MEKEPVDISLQYEGKTYEGWTTPSESLNAEGKPASYYVVLNKVFFGNVSSQDGHWSVDEQRPQALVNAVGEVIAGLGI